MTKLLLTLIDPSHWTFWIGIGISLAIFEVLDGSFFLLSWGLGCLFPALAAGAGVNSVAALVGTCVAGQIVVFLSVRPFFRRVTEGTVESMNSEALVGQFAYVTQEIVGLHNPGYVKIGGEEWRATVSSEETLKLNAKVVVLSVGGSTVTVELADEADGT